MRLVLDWMIGFTAPYTFTQVETTGNYSYRYSTRFTVHRYTRTFVLSLH
jgi:hypothetical protein